MKDILIATDLSSRSDRAIDRAVQLASQYSAHLHACYVVDDALPSVLAERLKAESELLLRQQLAATAVGGMEVGIDVRLGRAVDEIISAADARRADLVVLGAHRESTPGRDLFIGSTAWRVLRDARRPVLLVKNRTQGPYRRLLVAVDLTEASREALKLACRLSQQAEISAVHAFHVPFRGFLHDPRLRQETEEEHRRCTQGAIEAALQKLEPACEGQSVSIHSEVREGEVLGVISAECQRLRPDLLVIGSHVRSDLSHAFQGSIAEALLRAPPCDIVAVPAQ